MSEPDQPAAFDGAALRRARESKGLSRADLALAAKTDAEVVAMWEEQGVTPNPARMKLAAEAVGLAVSDLYKPDAGGLSPLAALRIKAGYGQRALAIAAKVSQPTVSRLERGATDLAPDVAAALAKALRVPVREVEAAARASAAGAGRGRAAPASARAKASAAPEAPAAHVVAVQDLVFHGGEAASEVPPARCWSPQDVALPGAPDDAAAVASRLREAGFSQFCVHKEAAVVLDGERSHSVRVQTSPPPAPGRQRVFDVLLARTTPHMDLPGAARAAGEKAAARAELLSGLPEASGGGRLLVAVEPDDTWGWALDQHLPYTAFAMAMLDHEAGELRLAAVHAGHQRVERDGETHDAAALGIGRETSLGEVYALLDGE